MERIKRIYNTAESLVKLMGWEVERLDIQHYHIGNGFDGFCGFLTTTENGSIRICADGTFYQIDHYKKNK